MRIATVLFSALALSSLAGCAAESTALTPARAGDTAVRAEARRISSDRPDRAEHLIAGTTRF